ncbi:MAG: phosphate starvation-inducible PhoH-like protein [Planctomycetota bacterium]
MLEVTIPLRSQDEAIQVLGPYDRNAKLLRKTLDIEIFTCEGNLRLKGQEQDVQEAERRVDHLLGKLRKGRKLDPAAVELILLDAPRQATLSDGTTERRGAERLYTGISPHMEVRPPEGKVSLRPRAIEPRSENQRRYLDAIADHALTFGIGAAGTGKTFLAVAAAVRALRSGIVRRLIITRPVVEAGEHLGFLPGDLNAKLDPYMRPVYDALFEIIGNDSVMRLEESGVIEIAPLAYMRGRTLSNAFVILDEAQNTTVGQMKMFLTRLGRDSTMVVTGDPTQTDLDGRQGSGFMDAVRRLRGFQGVAAVEFTGRDIVRHPLVEQIVKAYEGPARDESEGSR